MSYPDFTKPFIAHCDASEKGLVVVLYQEIDGKMKQSVTENFWDYLYYANELILITILRRA